MFKCLCVHSNEMLLMILLFVTHIWLVHWLFLGLFACNFHSPVCLVSGATTFFALKRLRMELFEYLGISSDGEIYCDMGAKSMDGNKGKTLID